MYSIRFYRDKSGKQPVKEYMRELVNTKGKDARIKLNKIGDYIQLLAENGATMGEPYMKHIEGDIWELRPLSERIFFVAWTGRSYVLLHAFHKKSQNTPEREKAQARRELKDLKERGLDNE